MVRLVFLSIVFVLFLGCAQQGSPTGGPRDEDPPVVVECIPENYSTGFSASRITITFDEYVQLDNINQELIVSPPMAEKPEVKLRKRSMLIELKDSLKANTTYTLNFGSAIKDLHEGNELLNYEYVFSSGEVLDSLSVRGSLKYAFDLSVPEEPVSILLYDDLRDSVPLLDIPLYVGRSNDSGVFSVNNLRADTFKVFALKDGNYNLRFDLPTEEIAFLDTNLVLDASRNKQLLEALGPIDTLPSQPDTVQADSLPVLDPDYTSVTIDLFLFTEESKLQYLAENKRNEPGKLELSFARPLSDSFNFRFLDCPSGDQPGFLPWFSHDRDSLVLWLVDSADYKRDTLRMELAYTVSDSMGLITRIDTLRFVYRDRSSSGRKGREAKKTGKLDIGTMKKNGVQHLNQDMVIDLPIPIKAIHDSLIHLYQIPDSVEVPFPFTIRRDSFLLTRAHIEVDWESASSYRLLILPGAIEGIYPSGHDSIDVPFTSRDTESYGRIALNLSGVDGPVVVQLRRKDEIVRQRYCRENGLLQFSFLDPGDYYFTVIHDRNENGKWDSGRYMEKLQPEEVEVLKGPVNVRANWDHEVSMLLLR